MTRKIQPPSIRPTNGKSHLFDRWARAIVQSKLGQLKEGGLVVDDRSRQQLGQAFAAGASVPRITVSDPAGYRQILYMDGGEGPETEESGGGGGETGTRRRKGFTRKEVEAVLAKGGKLSEGEILGGRVRYFIDGVMVGTKEFVENSYRLSRERFGPKRTTGARRMRGVETELHTARALQVDALGS